MFKDEETMGEKIQAVMLIDIYTNLQRIKSAADKDSEINYQIKAAEAKLSALGVPTQNLNIL